MRKSSSRVPGQVDERQQLGDGRRQCGRFAQLVDPERLGEHRADGLAGVERAVGILEDHLDAAAIPAKVCALKCANILAAVADRPFVGVQEPHEAACEGRLAASRFAYDPERLSLPYRQVHAVQRAHDPARRAHQHLAKATSEGKPLGKAAHLEKRFRH